VSNAEPRAGAAAVVCPDVVSEFELLAGVCVVESGAAGDERSDASRVGKVPFKMNFITDYKMHE